MKRYPRGVGIWKGTSRKRNLLREDVEDFEHERGRGGYPKMSKRK